jgi:hypothetical protein
MGRPIAKLEISAEERRELRAQLAVRRAPEDEKLRIGIVLACADGLGGEAIAATSKPPFALRFDRRQAGIMSAARQGDHDESLAPDRVRTRRDQDWE